MRKNSFDFIHSNNLESILALNKLKTKSKKILHLRDFGIFCYNRGKDSGELSMLIKNQEIREVVNAGFFII